MPQVIQFEGFHVLIQLINTYWGSEAALGRLRLCSHSSPLPFFFIRIEFVDDGTKPLLYTVHRGSF